MAGWLATEQQASTSTRCERQKELTGKTKETETTMMKQRDARTGALPTKGTAASQTKNKSAATGLLENIKL